MLFTPDHRTSRGSQKWIAICEMLLAIRQI
uniref:Uncharacterized protein n=1 Tax=mine drainage metagenome TaxID=410659 RepID=E6QM95_9ZZZZ